MIVMQCPKCLQREGMSVVGFAMFSVGGRENSWTAESRPEWRKDGKCECPRCEWIGEAQEAEAMAAVSSKRFTGLVLQPVHPRGCDAAGDAIWAPVDPESATAQDPVVIAATDKDDALEFLTWPMDMQRAEAMAGVINRRANLPIFKPDFERRAT